MSQGVMRTGTTAALFGALVMGGAVSAGCAFPTVKVSEDRVVTAGVGAERFVLRNDVGDVTLVASDDVTEITAAVHVTGKGTTSDRAQEVLDNLVIVLRYDESEPGTLVGGVELDKKYKRNPYGASVDWEVVLPTRVAIDLNTDVGDVEVSGFVYGARVSGDVGDIRVVDLRGGVVVRNDVGDVYVSTDGEVEVRNDVGDIEIVLLEGAVGDVVANSDVGDVRIVVPSTRVGHVHATTDIGSVRSSFGGMEAAIHKKKSGTLIADLGGKSEPKIEAKSDVGDVRVETSGEAG